MARVMKDSGVAWIGEIPEGWRIGKTSLFFDIQLGKMLQPESSSAEDSFENYLCAANLGGNALKMNPLRQMWFSANDRKQFAVKKGDLLVVEGGDVASCDIIREEVNDLYIQNALHRVRSKSGYSVEYLRYLLMIAKASGHIDLVCNKATIAHFTKDKFGSLAFIVSSVAEQSRIAAFLDRRCAEIDRVIAATQRTIEEYRKLKQSIITEAVTHGVRGPRKMKDSGVEWIGEIPEEWEVTKTKSLASRIVVGVVIKPADHFSENGTVPFLRGINVKEYTINSEPMVYITQETNQMLSKSIVHTDDLLIVRDGSIGTACVVPDEYDGANVVSMIIVTCEKGISPQFVCYSLNSDVGKTQFNITKIGTALNHTSVQSVSNILHIVPPFAEQMEIVKYLENRCAEIDRLIEAKQQLLTQLEAYKKSVIYEYVTGKWEVV